MGDVILFPAIEAKTLLLDTKYDTALDALYGWICNTVFSHSYEHALYIQAASVSVGSGLFRAISEALKKQVPANEDVSELMKKYGPKKNYTLPDYGVRVSQGFAEFAGRSREVVLPE